MHNSSCHKGRESRHIYSALQALSLFTRSHVSSVSDMVISFQESVSTKRNFSYSLRSPLTTVPSLTRHKRDRLLGFRMTSSPPTSQAALCVWRLITRNKSRLTLCITFLSATNPYQTRYRTVSFFTSFFATRPLIIDNHVSRSSTVSWFKLFRVAKVPYPLLGAMNYIPPPTFKLYGN